MTAPITADWNTLLSQAYDTADNYFQRSKRILEESGLEYTAADVIALAGVMAHDFQTTSIGVAAQNLAEAITAVGSAVDALASAQGG